MKRIIPTLALLGAFVGAPAAARADTSVLSQAFCTATAFQVCPTFGLVQVGAATSTDYQLTMTYTSTTAPAGQEGWMTTLGLYDLDGGDSWSFSNVAVVSDPGGGQNWAAGDCSGISGGGAASGAFSDGVCTREGPPGSIKGLNLGESVTISFTSSAVLAASDFSDAGGLGIRSHVQGFGPNGCSLKPDLREADNLVEGATGGDKACGTPPSTIPEPISMTLLATGLVGLGAAKRRRGKHSADEEISA